MYINKRIINDINDDAHAALDFDRDFGLGARS